jgi:hypothetical protein
MKVLVAILDVAMVVGHFMSKLALKKFSQTDYCIWIVEHVLQSQNNAYESIFFDSFKSPFFRLLI